MTCAVKDNIFCCNSKRHTVAMTRALYEVTDEIYVKTAVWNETLPAF